MQNIHYPSRTQVSKLNSVLLLNKIELVQEPMCLHTAVHNYKNADFQGLTMEQIRIIELVIENPALQRLQTAFNHA